MHDLVAQARDGDRAAFAALVESRLDRVFRTASAMLNSEADARDVVQEAFLSAWQHLPKLRKVSAFDAWLNQLIRNRCRDVLRQRRRSREIDLTGFDPAIGDTTASVAESAALSAAFDRLNPDQRAPDALGKRRSLGTHVFAWEALATWASLPESGGFVGQLVAPGGIPVTDWLTAFGVGGAMPAVADDWLTTWGIDLQRFADDRDLRNEFSYGPEGLRDDQAQEPSGTRALLEQLWTALEPAPQLPFWVLDRHLLRAALETGFRQVTGRSARQGARDFEIRSRASVKTVGPGLMTEDEWVDFLMRRLEPGDPPLLRAAAARGPLRVGPHIPVCARAVMLLRLASGAARHMLEEAHLTPSMWESWWIQRAVEQGLWSVAAPPASAVDLWADIRDALEDVATWATAAPANPSPRDFLEENARALIVLFQAERAGLWSLVA